MTAKEILLRVAENLPTNATLLDAINELEMFIGAEDLREITHSLREEAPSAKPEWLYESPSRLRTALRQTQKPSPSPSRSFCE